MCAQILVGRILFSLWWSCDKYEQLCEWNASKIILFSVNSPFVRPKNTRMTHYVSSAGLRFDWRLVSSNEWPGWTGKYAVAMSPISRVNDRPLTERKTLIRIVSAYSRKLNRIGIKEAASLQFQSKIWTLKHTFNPLSSAKLTTYPRFSASNTMKYLNMTLSSLMVLFAAWVSMSSASMAHNPFRIYVND